MQLCRHATMPPWRSEHMPNEYMPLSACEPKRAENVCLAFRSLAFPRHILHLAGPKGPLNEKVFAFSSLSAFRTRSSEFHSVKRWTRRSFHVLPKCVAGIPPAVQRPSNLYSHLVLSTVLSNFGDFLSMFLFRRPISSGFCSNLLTSCSDFFSLFGDPPNPFGC